MLFPIIKTVTGLTQQNRLTTIFFDCDFLDGRGTLNRSFQINDYEMHWYYKGLGFDQRYCPFTDFWATSSLQEKHSFLFLMITDSKCIISQSVRAKLQAEFRHYMLLYPQIKMAS